jgi:hypothetical protein
MTLALKGDKVRIRSSAAGKETRVSVFHKFSRESDFILQRKPRRHGARARIETEQIPEFPIITVLPDVPAAAPVANQR